MTMPVMIDELDIHPPQLWAPTPPGDRYACICLDPGERKTAGGLWKPAMHSQKTMAWLVVAAGPGKWQNGVRCAPQYKVGDILLAYKLTSHHKYDGHPIHTLGQDIHVIAEDVFVGAITDVEWPTIPYLTLAELQQEA